MNSLWPLFLQAEQLPGSGAWLGSAGILGLLLYWLFFHHLPAKDRQIADLLRLKDDQANSIIERFEKSLDAQAKHNQEVYSGLSKVISIEMTNLSKSIDSLTLMVSEVRSLAISPKKKTDHA